ncbi:MAG: hypothetical protein JXN61_04955 [Sedimentisphaerales bacterium]|nr:hypothetical protein [Sedimentisphaerales bacterium]
MDDVERRKDVFAWFGGAAYYAQCFEAELQTLLLLTYRLNHPNASLSDLDGIDIRISGKNLGALLQELGKSFTLHPEFSALLNTYREKRNYLMHHFFFDNARKLFSPHGCDAIVEELKELSRVFQEADAIAQEMSKRMRKLAGISEDQIDAIVRAELKKDTEQDEKDD